MAVKVSIIVPVYNQQAYIVQCLQSLLAQTLQDIEIICINDGSTDGSLAIIKQFAKTDKRLVILDRPNQGTGSARNAGLNAAIGEYVGFVDADDFADADYFEALYTKAKEEQAEICCAVRRKEINAAGQEREVKTPVFDNMEKFKKQLLFTSAHLWSKIFLRRFVQENNLQNAQSKHSQDLAFSIPAILLANRICWTDKSAYHYRILDTSSSRARISAQDCAQLADIYALICRHPLTAQQQQLVMERLKSNARYYGKRVNFKNRVTLFKHILATFPSFCWKGDYKTAYVWAKVLNVLGATK